MGCFGMQGYPAVCAELDLVEQDDQVTNAISLSDQIDPEISLGNRTIYIFLALV